MVDVSLEYTCSHWEVGWGRLDRGARGGLRGVAGSAKMLGVRVRSPIFILNLGKFWGVDL